MVRITQVFLRLDTITLTDDGDNDIADGTHTAS